MNTPQSPQRLGKYELREQLGRGGMAEVWKAFDTQLQRYVAIKILHANLQADPEFITRFTREARVIASLHHPNIVQIHDFQTIQFPGSSVPSAYMVMDYVEGQTLAQYIRSTSQAGKFPSPIEIVRLFTSISKAIDYAHQKGMIHRDIKPANILLDKRNTTSNPMGEPVLTDFGIARLLDTTSGTMSGMWLGTPLYISPEQAQGQPGNERSDIYSLGIILYEICSGVQPFRGETATAITWQHMHALPTPPSLINPTVSPALAQVIMQAIAKDPAYRFSSASAMTAALATAFHVPMPEDAPFSTIPLEDMAEPTHLSSRLSTLSPHVTPIINVTPIGGTSSPYPYPSPGTMPVFSPPTPTPPFNVPGSSFNGPTGRNTQGELPAYPSPVTPLPIPPSSTKSWWGRRWLVVALVAIALLLLASSSIGALYLFSGKHTGSNTNATTAAASSRVVGDVYFLNSGQVNTVNSKGIDDVVQVNLQNVSNPPPGKSYYAWLSNVPIGEEGSSILLGALQVNHGSAQLLYHDSQGDNLLLNAKGFLVTEEVSNPVPNAPSPDRSTWRFFSIPAVVTLTHLTHLLANSPELTTRQLYGGLGIWLLRNTEKMVEWASSARDNVYDNSPNKDLIHRQIVHILDFIDGSASVSMDVPPNTPLYLDTEDTHAAQVALLGPTPHMEPAGNTYKGEVAPGYVYLIPVHLTAAVEAPQATASQRQIANQIHSALSQVTQDLNQARQDAKQLVILPVSQLLTSQAQSLLNDLVAATQSAYTGPTNPNLPQGGASGIYQNLQRMATFEVQRYTTK